MTAEFQLVIDCADPEPLARFWVAALGYEFQPPSDGYDNWDGYWPDVGERGRARPRPRIHRRSGCEGPADLVTGGAEKKTLKNRLHIDITVSGGRANPIETRRRSSTR
jgi:hypothetical protein